MAQRALRWTTWRVPGRRRRWSLQVQQDPTTFVDLVPEGAALTLVLGAEGSYSFIYVSPWEPTEDEAGVYEVSGTTLTLSVTGTGSPEAWEISRNGDTMTLTDSAEVFDFVDGVEEDATLVITLVRL